MLSAVSYQPILTTVSYQPITTVRYMGEVEAWATVGEQELTEREYAGLSGTPGPCFVAVSPWDKPVKLGLYGTGRTDHTGKRYGIIMTRKVVDLLSTIPRNVQEVFESSVEPRLKFNDSAYGLYVYTCQTGMMQNALEINRADQLIAQFDLDLCKTNYDGVSMRIVTTTKPNHDWDLDLWSGECFGDDLWWWVIPPSCAKQSEVIIHSVNELYIRTLERTLKYKQRGVKIYPRDSRPWAFSLGYTPESKTSMGNEMPVGCSSELVDWHRSNYS
jgi:hypothetical protein